MVDAARQKPQLSEKAIQVFATAPRRAFDPGFELKNEGGSVKLVIIGIDHLVMLLSPFCYVDMAN